MSNTEMLSLRELGQVLVKHFGHTEGLWDVAFEFRLGVGAFGPSPEHVLPSAMMGISKVGIQRADKTGPHTIDAAALVSNK